MSAEQEYEYASDLIAELYKKSRDCMLLQESEVYLIENNIQDHIEKMVSLIRKGQYGKTTNRMNVYYFDINTNSAETEMEYALDLLKKLFEMAHDSRLAEYYLRYLQGEIICHLKNMRMLHTKLHEEKYYETIIKPWMAATESS
jgi:hypothetical protein